MLTAIGDVMRESHERGWITTRDGNISLRKTGSNTLYITPSGWRKTIIHPEHIVKCKIVDANVSVPGGSKPSGELHMHWMLQRHSTKTRAVVHLHATHIVAAMFAGWDLRELARQFPEVNRYTRVGPNVPTLPATSRELGDVTGVNLGCLPDGSVEYDIVGQANHGVCAVAGDPWSAFEHIERLDHICEIVLKSGVKPT
jgi:ribulose-5-phosphate 4-epimerase/fuculose-1-phosphate aldolase